MLRGRSMPSVTVVSQCGVDQFRGTRAWADRRCIVPVEGGSIRRNPYHLYTDGRVLRSPCTKETTMDFIERLFGIAPDGGSGTLELALFLIPLAGVLLLWYVRQRKTR